MGMTATEPGSLKLSESGRKQLHCRRKKKKNIKQKDYVHLKGNNTNVPTLRTHPNTNSTGILSSCLLIRLPGQALHVISAAVCSRSSSSNAISHDLIHEREKYCSLIARHPAEQQMGSVSYNTASQAAGKSAGQR